MLELKEIRDEATTLAAFLKFSSGTELPTFLFHDPDYRGVVLELLKDGQQIGLFFGVMVEDDPNFYLHHISLDTEHWVKETAIRFVEMAFAWIKRKCLAEKVIINLTQEDDSEPAVLNMLGHTASVRIETMQYIGQVGIKTAGFDHLRGFRWYRPQFLEKKGYEVLFWKDYSQQELRQLQQEEANWKAEDPGYLSPGVWEARWKYDRETSCALVKKGERKPIGWMVTERQKNGSVVKVRRFYMLKAQRKHLVGHAFGSHMLELIAPCCEVFQYEVVKGNRQIEAFTDNFCIPILAFHYFRCNVIINLETEDKEDGMDTGKTK